MDKNAIKKYAIWARNELIARVTQKAEQYEITEKKTTPGDADSINGRLLTNTEKKQRKALIAKIQEDGFEQVMEEVAYTWFNRFTALRFMEVNNYLPSRTRVFTNEAGEFKPQILADAIQLDLEGLDMDKVFELKDANKTEELYKYLLIVQCNALSSILPRMFQKIEHYTELLLPDYLLREGSVIEQMISLIPEEDWTDQVQIIGWLYQYYNSEPKDAVFAALKKNVKISKENIPAATQLFTPDWIVRYMVENSLGRLWLEGHPNETLKSEWKYYLEEAEQEADVQKQLNEIRKEYAELKPEEIRCIDPCMGSGHILCYMFDVLVKIYEDYGYTAREAVGSIVEKNLWGLDIDERAAQLSYFAVMMKARQYDRRFLTRGIQPHVYAIEESNGITSAPMHDMGIELSKEDYREAAKQAMRLVEEMHDAKEYGSLVHVTPCNWELLRRFAVPRCVSENQLSLDIHGEIEASGRLQVLINIGEALSQKYHAAVTNPPYMGSGGMSQALDKFVKKNYADSKSDLFAVFIERIKSMLSVNAYQAMITQHAWMFLTSFEKLRAKSRDSRIVNMAHLGSRAFDEIGGEVVQTTAFVTRKGILKNYNGVYVRLVEPTSQQGKEDMFLSGENRYIANQDIFENISGEPIAYWISDSVYSAYVNAPQLSEVASPKQGLATTDNNRFVRFWYEVMFDGIGFGLTSEEANKSGLKWFPLNKGGEYRKWYGNNDYIVNYQFDGQEIKANVLRKYTYLKTPDFVVKNQSYYFKENGTWSAISTGNISVRYSPKGFVISNAGMAIYSDDSLKYIIAFMNSKCVSQSLLRVISQTLNYNAGDIEKIPFILDSKKKDRIIELADSCISESKTEWDAFETSWDFQKHPLIGRADTIEQAYIEWEKECDDRFNRVKSLEEEINQEFIDIYSLEDELDPLMEDSEVTIRRADVNREIRSLISYAVGCMFGRYSLDCTGLIYAGGKWDDTKYFNFIPDADGIIPICDDEYFADDIVGLFITFIEVAFGRETLEENLTFVAKTLGGKGTSRDVIRLYFINDFYSDHLKVYQKRPIYWLFDSGKKNGFKCLIYMHRYHPDTIARIRTDYVHEQQSRYRTAINDLEQRINSAGTSEKVRLNKRLSSLQSQSEELRKYEEHIHHLADQMIQIDPDDGVKNNYSIFKDVLAKL